MSFTSIIQVLAVNDTGAQTSKKTGNKYRLVEAQCALLKDDGSVDVVGGLNLPGFGVDDVAQILPPPGLYMGQFAIQRNYQDGKLGARLTGLSPLPADYFKATKVASSTKGA